MREQQAILFNNGGLDSDTADRFKAPGNSDYILNDIISFDGDQGSRVNVKGTALAATLGTKYTPVGRVEDIERNSVIIFLHSNDSQHRIISVNRQNDAITNILNNQPLLNFSLSHKIVHANVVGELLYWTDGFNPPRKINLTKAIDFSAGNSDGYSAVTEEVINAAKPPPSRPPLARGFFDTGMQLIPLGYFSQTTIRNNLRRDTFQFCYRYIFDDEEKSIFSPFSVVPIPVDEGRVTGVLNPNLGANSAIRLSLNSGPEIVEKLELAVKINATGAWQSYDIIDKQEDSIGNNVDFQYTFLNDRSTTPLDESVVLSTLNAIPDAADVQEFVPTNELVYGRVTEGRDNIDIDVSTSKRSINSDYVQKSRVVTFNELYSAGHYINYTFPDTLDPDIEFFALRLQQPNGTVSEFRVDAADITDYPADVKNAFVDAITDTVPSADKDPINQPDPLLPGNTISWDPDDGDYQFGRIGNVRIFVQPFRIGSSPDPDQANTIYFLSHINRAESKEEIIQVGLANHSRDQLEELPYPNDVERFIDSAIIYTNLDTETTFSSSLPDPVESFGTGEYQLGIVYDDGYGRISAVQTNDDALVEITGTNLIANGDPNGLVEVDFTIRHRPPDWARYWRPVITRNLSQEIIANWTPDFAYGFDDGNRAIYVFSISSSLSESITSVGGQYQPYVFQQGDLIRFQGNSLQPISPHFSTGDNIFAIINDEFNVRQQGTVSVFNSSTNEFEQQQIPLSDDEGNPLFNQAFQNIVVDARDTYTLRQDQLQSFFNRKSILQIVRPVQRSDNQLYFGTGFSFPVGNPGTATAYHMVDDMTNSNNQSQSPTNPTGTPAVIALRSGGVYRRIRWDAAKRIDFPVLDPTLSDLYSSNYSSYGKPYLENDEAERRTYNILRHSGRYFDNTNINDLNFFNPSNYITIDDKFGPIRRIIQVGDALKVYQPRKVTSVYIGKSFIKQGDGTDQVMTVDRTFGVVNPSPLDFGCDHPESVLRNERYVYFFDVNSGSFIRDAANGLEAISMNLMDGYFKSKAREIISSGISNVDVVTGYDHENNAVYVTFRDSTNSMNNETIGYHEPSNRWMSFYSFIPTMYMHTGNKLYGYLNGNLYRHNEDTVNRCLLYGTKYNHEYRIFANANFHTPKIFYNLAIHSNHNGWSVPNISIDPGINYPRGMSSRLNNSRFTFQDGVAYAAFLRNMLTTSSTASVTDLFNGDQLRGESMAITLSENSNSKTNLYQADITFRMA